MTRSARPVLLLVLSAASGIPTAARSRTFVVDTTADTQDALPGDGLCADASGACSLRAAIAEANTSAVAASDLVDVPAGLYVLALGNLGVTASMTILGAGSGGTIIDGNLDNRGTFTFGQTLYARILFQGTDTSNGQLVPRAVATATDSFLNCLAAEGCLGKPGLVDTGGSDPVGPIAFDFSISPAEIAAVSQPGMGLLMVQASRDIGHKFLAAVSSVQDVVPAGMDGTAIGELFETTIDTCPPGENFNPIRFDCGPNFHNDVRAASSLFVPAAALQAAAQDGQLRVLLSPTTGAGNLGVGRLKIAQVQLVYLKQVNVTLRGFTVQRGSSAIPRTSTIFNVGARVEASDFVVKDSFGSAGGAIWNQFGTVRLQDSTIAQNTGQAGGGIYNAPLATLVLERSTVSGNIADTVSGGGIYNAGELRLTNTTISGNLAKLGGGGVYNIGSVEIDFSTITDNSADYTLVGGFDPAAVGGGIANVCVPGACGFVTMADSILAGNRDGRETGLPSSPALFSPDCYSPGPLPDPSIPPNDPRLSLRHFDSRRNNMIGNVPAKTGPVNAICDIRDKDSSVSDDTPFDLVGRPSNALDPGLEPLADNGGLTRTHALEPGSPAIDAVTAEPGVRNCVATDQRSFRRPGDTPGDTFCDIGAYEAGALTAIPQDAASGASPVSVMFSGIVQPGVTTLQVLTTGPNLPSGFMLGNPPLFYEVSTTATFTPPATVCIDYTGTTFQNVATLRLFHFEDTTGDGVADAWVDRTILPIDTVNQVICASVTSLSLFAALEHANRPPVADAGPDQDLECRGPRGTRAKLDGSRSSDPDGDPLRFEWRSAGGAVVGSTSRVDVLAPLGTRTFTLRVEDPQGLGAVDQVQVTVNDTIPPSIVHLAARPDVLRPPDDRLVLVKLAVVAIDRCDPSPSCRFVSVASNEHGTGPGGPPDWEIAGDLAVRLRAESSASRPERVYTITVQCTDDSGNAASKTVAVRVPRDRIGRR